IAIKSKDEEELKQRAERVIEQVYHWGTKNFLTFNRAKTKFCLFTKKRKIPNIELNLGNDSLQQSSELKILGVQFDCRLNFQSHVREKIRIIKAISNRLHSTIALSYGPNSNFINISYRALILPIISYAIPVWKSILKFRFIRNKLNSLQRLWALRATRSFRSTASLDLRAMAKYLSLDSHLNLQAESHDIM